MTDDKKIRVLVVDDDDNVRFVAALRLRQLGFDVMVAPDGREALRALDENDIDVVLLDLHMPVMDGREFLRAYKGSAAIVVMSGWGDIEEGLPREVAASIAKPMTMDEVAPVLRAAALR